MNWAAGTLANFWFAEDPATTKPLFSSQLCGLPRKELQRLSSSTLTSRANAAWKSSAWGPGIKRIYFLRAGCLDFEISAVWNPKQLNSLVPRRHPGPSCRAYYIAAVPHWPNCKLVPSLIANCVFLYKNTRCYDWTAIPTTTMPQSYPQVLSRIVVFITRHAIESGLMAGITAGIMFVLLPSTNIFLFLKQLAWFSRVIGNSLLRGHLPVYTTNAHAATIGATGALSLYPVKWCLDSIFGVLISGAIYYTLSGPLGGAILRHHVGPGGIVLVQSALSSALGTVIFILACGCIALIALLVRDGRAQNFKAKAGVYSKHEEPIEYMKRLLQEAKDENAREKVDIYG